jgi:hypothetical protein
VIDPAEVDVKGTTMAVANWLIGLALTLQVPPPASNGPSIELERERQAIVGRETKSLETLAEHLAGQGDRSGAKDVRARIELAAGPDGASRFVPRLEIIPPGSGKSKGLASIPAKDQTSKPWIDELEAIRSAAARDLFGLASRAATTEPRQYALADECLRGVVARVPDHPDARRLLGYVAHDGGWATPFAVRQLRDGKLLDSTYGWVPVSWVPHLEQGELPAPSEPKQKQVRWLPAAEADALHHEWSRGWTITTEHFEIHTNVPLAEAITFGRQLEAFHDLFFALMADVIGPNLPLAQRFQDKATVGERGGRPPHLVYYFATKEEYVEHLSPTQGPDINQSLGFYDPPRAGKAKRLPAYFFRDVNGQLPVTATLYHEVSHQLLFESAGPNAFARNVGNYWVFEGLGTYFETVQSQPDGSLEVGGLVGPRIEVARQRLIGRGEHVPLARMVALDQQAFNQKGDVHLNYAEAMALTVFLMQANGEQYREPFLDYVKDAYRGRIKRTTGRSLEDRLGVPYGTLDEQFLAYLKTGAKVGDDR